MENLRSIISNLYIYRNSGNDKSYLNYLEETPLPIRNNDNSINDSNIYTGTKINRPCRHQNIEKLDKKKLETNFIMQANNNSLIKPNINYVEKNKELLKQKEYYMKELKLKKENDALNLLLSQKAKKFGGVKSKIFDYESKHEANRKKLLKKGQYKIRSKSSQNGLRPSGSQQLIKNHLNNLNNNILNTNTNLDSLRNSANNLEENRQNLNSYTLKQVESPYKYYNNIVENIKLPNIYTSVNIQKEKEPFEDIPILHKDYGKIPAYLEQRKEELKLKKEEDKKREKEKNLPKGTRILSEQERQERHDELILLRRELENELFKLPIAKLSKRQIERKAEIEKALYEIDEKLNKLIGYREVLAKV